MKMSTIWGICLHRGRVAKAKFCESGSPSSVATSLRVVLKKTSGGAGEEGEATPGNVEEEKTIPPAAYMTLSFV